MNKNGFILLEMLRSFILVTTAFVSLAGIVADIETAKNTVFLYAKEIKTEYMLQSLLENPDDTLPTTGKKTVATSILIEVNMKNKPICEKIEINANGNVSLSNCVANGIPGLSFNNE